jgi:HD-like signal output (HDOD) protein
MHSGHLHHSIKNIDDLTRTLVDCKKFIKPTIEIEKISKYAKIVSVDQIPEMPTVVVELKKALSKKYVNFNTVVQIIERNAIVAGDVIGTLNSPVFQQSISKPFLVKTVNQALQMVGTECIFDIVVTSALKTIPNRNKAVQEVINHSTLVAMACAEISGYVPIIEISDAYLFGLFMHSGMIMMANKHPELFEETFNLYKTIPQAAIEKQLLSIGVEHNYLGVLVARKWGISESNQEILFAIQEQENKQCYCIENDLIRVYIGIGLLANIIVNEVCENVYISSDFNNRYELAKKILNLTEDGYKNIRKVLSESLPKIKTMQKNLNNTVNSF